VSREAGNIILKFKKSAMIFKDVKICITTSKINPSSWVFLKTSKGNKI